MRKISVVFLAIVLLLIVGCGRLDTELSPGTDSSLESIPSTPTHLPGILTGSDTAGEFRKSACPFVLPEDLVQGEDVECGYLPVYENWEGGGSEGGRLIRLAVAVFHPPGGATQPDPVIYLSGGPGGSILKLAGFQVEPMSEPVFDTGRSLILFDQRGVGLSQPALDCTAFNEKSLDLLDYEVDGRDLTFEEIKRLTVENLRGCRDKLAEKADLSAYNTVNNAMDVHALKEGLGYEQVNLWGGSYGTRLALEVMRLHPDDLRSVVLDAVYPPDVDLYLEAPGNFQRALTQMMNSCEENPYCQEAYPDLEAVLFETVVRLNDAPVSREITNPVTGEKFNALIRGDNLLGLTFQMLYDSKLRYFIPEIIYNISKGDYNYLDKVYGSILQLRYISSQGMMLSVQCHEELSFSTQEDHEKALAEYPQYASMYRDSIIGGLGYEVCTDWGVGQAEASANQPVYSDIPTLIMNGEFDPITPPAWGFHAAETLENAFVYEFPGAGHGSSLIDDCPKGMLVAFLEDPLSEPESGCIKGMQ